jgi:hypothetical protein
MHFTRHAITDVLITISFFFCLDDAFQIASFSVEEKVNVTTGVGWANGRCVGNIPIVKDWPGLCLEVIYLTLTVKYTLTSFWD